tara:strand:+ start:414 stop:809 length:396 start_codon:yes stop_codon:yes gene_type:complete
MLDMKFEDVSAEELENEILIETMDHFGDMKDELGFNSIWSIFDGGSMEANEALFKDRQYLVKYKFIRPDATLEDMQNDKAWGEVSTFSAGGTIKDLWTAAESCIKQSGTHHMYIEDFTMQDDGSFQLVTGS